LAAPAPGAPAEAAAKFALANGPVPDFPASVGYGGRKRRSKCKARYRGRRLASSWSPVLTAGRDGTRVRTQSSEVHLRRFQTGLAPPIQIAVSLKCCSV
jgi:hypothetical protein